MKLEGEYIFGTFDEALDFISEPTNYEKEHKIFIVKKRIVFDAGDIKIVAFEKSDNSNTIFLFFKNSMSSEIWKFWCPSENQIEWFSVISAIIFDINKINARRRNNVRNRRNQ